LYLPIEKIEKIFWRALEFVDSISDLNLVQKYWWFDHNKYLKHKKFKDFEERFEKLCMVIPCEILGLKNGAIVKSEFFDRTVELKTDFVDVKPGDKVTKHYNYICEKISENLYLNMIESLKKII